METKSEIAEKPKRWPKRLAIILIVLAGIISIAIIGFLVYASDYYRDLDADGLYHQSTKDILIEQEPGYLTFGKPGAEKALIFYPGAKVQYSSYSPVMLELAEQGYFCVLVQMPFNFAFLDVNAAQPIIKRHSDISHWWVGGHSLGGSMAANYAASHASELEGLLLLGSYSADNLSNTDLAVLSIYGSNDDILNRDSLASNRSLMPASYTEHVIEGGNHAYFGNYGDQAGDGQATITPQKQWHETVLIAADAMN